MAKGKKANKDAQGVPRQSRRARRPRGDRSTHAIPSTPITPRTPSTPSTPRTPSTPSTAITPGRTTDLTGNAIVQLAQAHIGEDYVFGARVPLGNADWTGPWDCAEFASWCVFQTTGIVYGAEPRSDVILAESWTGYWDRHVSELGIAISVERAARIPGACILRRPVTGRAGHIAISDGEGGTIEAHSTGRGVIGHTISGRRWDIGVLVPDVRYFMSETAVSLQVAPNVLRVTSPMMRGPRIVSLQQTLVERGYNPGVVDGVFGGQTEAALQQFQLDNDLVPDGEVGPDTLRALGIEQA